MDDLRRDRAARRGSAARRNHHLANKGESQSVLKVGADYYVLASSVSANR